MSLMTTEDMVQPLFSIDLVEPICSYLDRTTLVTASLVSKKWQKATHSILWDKDIPPYRVLVSDLIDSLTGVEKDLGDHHSEIFKRLTQLSGPSQTIPGTLPNDL